MHIQFPTRPELSAELNKFLDWHKSAYGWRPDEDILCLHCKKPVVITEAYRCYDCHARMHLDCIKIHCKDLKI